MQPINILFTTVSNGHSIIPLFREALGKHGKIFMSNSIMTGAFLQADGYTISPPIYDDSYIDFLINYCLANNITAILSWIEIDLPVLAKNKERFRENGITVIVSDEPVIRLCNDKWKTHLFLASLGLPQPKTYIDLDLFKHDIQNGKISFPVIVKPRWGISSEGLYQINSAEELDVLYQKSYKNNYRHYVKYLSNIEPNPNAIVIIQEKIGGQEYGLDVFNDLNGNYVVTIPKTKTEMRLGATCTSIVQQNVTLEQTGKTISQNLKHIANIGVDCFLTPSGEAVVIEINPRFAVHYAFSQLAGANFPAQIIEWLAGNPTSEKYITFKTGVKGYIDFHLPIRV